MRIQKIALFLFLATLAVGCDRYGGFSGCWGCYGFDGCAQWDLTDDHFIRHESALPFCLYFSVQGADKLGPFGPSANGTTNSSAIAHIGIQHFLSRNLAFRALLNFSTESDGADSNEVTSNEYGIGLGVLYYFRPLYNIATYVGGGLGYNTSKVPNYQPPDVIGSGQSPQGSAPGAGETKTNTFGITAVAGFDWYLTPNIAIGTEYALGFSSSGGTYTPQGSSTSTDLPTSTSIGIAPAGNLHMLIHF